MSILQLKEEKTTLACRVTSLEKRPPNIVTKTVEVLKEKEKCQNCSIEQLEKEIHDLKSKNRHLSWTLENIKGNNKLLIIFGVIATIFSIYRNENIINELKPIFNWFISIYNQYEHLTEISLLSTNAINNIVLKVLAIIGVSVLCCGISSILVGLIAYLIGEYIAPFIENTFDDIIKIVFLCSLSIVIFIGGELKSFIPSPIGDFNIFFLWLILFLLFFIVKTIK
ncbi:MAG: DUF6040 family protein, partial [Alphaproteobacteria bacterium]|nr:DUF6040 family protein [Alphaproteobacteria bacterium]